VSLFGTARVYKRSRAVCAALCELYDLGLLSFSFEIQYTMTTQIDGIEYIDAADGNVITGMAVVSYPAYPESKALLLVAQKANEEADTGSDEPEDAASSAGADTQQERVTNEMQMTIEQAMARIAELERMAAAQAAQIAAIPEPPKEAMVTQASHDAAIAERDGAIQTLETQVAAFTEQAAELDETKQTLASVQGQLDAMKAEQAEADLQSKRDELTAFAATNGLDTEDEAVSAAIAAADYAALVAAAMKAAAEKDGKPGTSTASQRPMADIGAQEPYGGILGRRTE